MHSVISVRVLHHEREGLPEQRRVEGVDGGVALPHLQRRLVVPPVVGVEDIPQLLQNHVGKAPYAGREAIRLGLVPDREDPLGNVLGHVTNALDVAGDANGRDHLPEVHGHRLAAHDQQDGALLRFALGAVETPVGRDDRLSRGHISSGKGDHGILQHRFGGPTHLSEGSAQIVKIEIKGCDDVVIRHDGGPPSRH